MRPWLKRTLQITGGVVILSAVRRVLRGPRQGGRPSRKPRPLILTEPLAPTVRVVLAQKLFVEKVGLGSLDGFENFA